MAAEKCLLSTLTEHQLHNNHFKVCCEDCAQEHFITRDTWIIYKPCIIRDLLRSGQFLKLASNQWSYRNKCLREEAERKNGSSTANYLH